MKVRFSARARAELDAIYTYISNQNPTAAQRAKASIREAAEQLGDFPYIAPKSDLPGIRVWSASPYPYRIYYTIRNEGVLILHIRHTSRRSPSIGEV